LVVDGMDPCSATQEQQKLGRRVWVVARFGDVTLETESMRRIPQR